MRGVEALEAYVDILSGEATADRRCTVAARSFALLRPRIRRPTESCTSRAFPANRGARALDIKAITLIGLHKPRGDGDRLALGQ